MAVTTDHPRDQAGKYLYYAGTFWLYLRPGAAGRPTRRPPTEKRFPPGFFLHCFGVHQITSKSSDPSPTAKACFERVLASVGRSSLYMGTAAGFDIALVIAKASLTKATDRQVERLGHESSLDENVT